MPIYTYRCDHCGVQFERHQKFSEAPLKVCPECNEDTLRKLYQPVGIVFKGSGFYSTDNRSSSKRSSTKSQEKSKSSTETESTSEKKAPSKSKE
ncbi:MAG: zinc ribbon domain-containing protein [Anaerolineales bacterium]|nr:zinc ribbon domain-containing protein [Anaerolineales bacterium]